MSPKILVNKDAKKVAVGLSGGVDSSVAALLLRREGYEIVGVHMKCWDYDTQGCRGDQDRIDAIRVANNLGIKFEFLDFQREYKERVIDYFYSEYRSGRTPNPDVYCNREIKFGLFLEWALKNGFSHVATGHYARISYCEEDSTYSLLAGVDETKDQSYFLYVLGQKELTKALFPLGEMKKYDVREIAKKHGFHNSEKPDSVGICFVGDVNIKDFLRERINEHEGEVVNERGEVLGKHAGVSFYTIGQRHGFEITKYIGLPVYVVGKNVRENKLIVGFYDEALRPTFTVGNLHSVSGISPNIVFEDGPFTVRIRHLGEFYPCKVRHKSFNGTEAEGLFVELESPVFGVAPGQHAVFYDGARVVGGGVILE